MHILIAAFFPRAIDVEGIGRVVSSLGESFHENGHEVTMVAPFDSSNSAGLKCVNYMDTVTSGSFYKNHKAYKQAVLREAEECELIFAVEISATFLMSSSFLIKRDKNLFVITLGVILDKSIFKTDKFSLQNVNHFFLKNAFWKYFFPLKKTRYIVSTNFQREQLKRLNVPESNIHVIPYGINPDKFRPWNKEDMRKEFNLNGKKIISYIGHFSPIKGVPNLIKAYAELLKEDDDLVCAIAWSGKGMESKRVHDMIDEYGLKEKIILFGKIDVPKFLSAVDILILPFRNASVPHYPLLILEAFAVGVPVISTKVGGIPELVENNKTGVVVNPNQPEELAQAIKELLDDKELCERISENQRLIYATKFDSYKVSNKYTELSNQHLTNAKAD